MHKLTDEQRALILPKTLKRLETAERKLIVLTGLFGDANGDGNVNASDALLSLQHSVKLILLQGMIATAVDVNGDGSISAADALLILQHSVKLIDDFPVEIG